MGRHRKGKGKSAKNARKGQNPEAVEEQYKACPHSIVFHRGHVGINIRRLVKDVRRVMEPFTASSLKIRKKNVFKDFVTIAGPLNVSHLLAFSKSETATHLRIVRLARGPTMTFRVISYSLGRDVVSSLKRNQATQSQYLHHPLLVMNHFSGQGMQLKLMATMFQNMFPSINVNKLNLKDVKRCVLLNYNAEDKTIEFRHYNVRVVPVGMTKAVKKLVRGSVPNLSKYNDISDFVLRDGNLSESEVEMDGPHNEVTLPQDLPGRGNVKMAKSAIRLTEIGPRMSLQLIKIEDGVCSGEVLFHEFISKTPEEVRELDQIREKKRQIKEERRKQQEENVKKKQSLKEDMKKKSVEGMKKKVQFSDAAEAIKEESDDDVGVKAEDADDQVSQGDGEDESDMDVDEEDDDDYDSDD